MTPEEKQMLTDLANKIAQAPAPAIDPEADQLIKTRIGSRPDALYVLTQTVLIQNIALEHAKTQIQDLQQRLAQAPGTTQQPGSSFLGQTPGNAPGSRWTAPPTAPPPPGYYAPPPQAAPAYPPPQAAPGYPPPAPAAPSGASSFLRSAAVTATGVAAGALAFEGIRSLFGGGQSMGFGGYPQSGFVGGSGFGGMAPSETVVNNYYESPDRDASDLTDTGRDDFLDPNDDSGSLDDSSTDSLADVSDDSSFSDDSSGGGDDLI